MILWPFFIMFQGSPVGEDVHEQLAQSEHLMKEMSRTWEEKLVETGMQLLNTKLSSQNIGEIIILTFCFLSLRESPARKTACPGKDGHQRPSQWY